MEANEMEPGTRYQGDQALPKSSMPRRLSAYGCNWGLYVIFLQLIFVSILPMRRVVLLQKRLS